jgi:hypothetical protein
MNDLIAGADGVSQDFIQNYNKRQAILSELTRQKAKNQKIVERQNKKIAKVEANGIIDRSRVATQRIQQAEQNIKAIEALEEGESQLVRSLREGTIEDDLRDLEAEHRTRVQDAVRTVFSKNNNEAIADAKSHDVLSDEELDLLLEEPDHTPGARNVPAGPAVIDDENGAPCIVIGSNDMNIDVIDPVRFTRQDPTPDLLQRANEIKEKTGQISPKPVTQAPSKPGLSPFMPTTRVEMQQLLLALNLSSSMQMTNKETSDMLKTLLTCNETQLNALFHNAKLPVALKIIIKRILQDIQNGNTETVERLWDRIFGKTGMSDPALVGGNVSDSINSIIPGAPISREAYVLIRDTVINK